MGSWCVRQPRWSTQPQGVIWTRLTKSDEGHCKLHFNAYSWSMIETLYVMKSVIIEKDFPVHLITTEIKREGFALRHRKSSIPQSATGRAVGVTAYCKLLSASHHLFKPPETYIMHATPVQSPSRIKY